MYYGMTMELSHQILFILPKSLFLLAFFFLTSLYVDDFQVNFLLLLESEFYIVFAEIPPLLSLYLLHENYIFDLFSRELFTQLNRSPFHSVDQIFTLNKTI
jgi:hypothetical protein